MNTVTYDPDPIHYAARIDNDRNPHEMYFSTKYIASCGYVGYTRDLFHVEGQDRKAVTCEKCKEKIKRS